MSATPCPGMRARNAGSCRRRRPPSRVPSLCCRRRPRPSRIPTDRGSASGLRPRVSGNNIRSVRYRTPPVRVRPSSPPRGGSEMTGYKRATRRSIQTHRRSLWRARACAASGRRSRIAGSCTWSIFRRMAGSASPQASTRSVWPAAGGRCARIRAAWCTTRPEAPN